jgi:hypothetical protein
LQGVRGRIGATVYLGNLSQYRVEIGPGRAVEVQQMGSDLLEVGEQVVLEIDPLRCVFIADARGRHTR